MRLEADGVVEAALVLDAVDVQGADTDAVAREADANVALRKLLLVEERADGVRERVFVTHLAVDDDAGGERAAREAEQLVATLGLGDDRRCELRGADLQSDDLAALATLALRRLLGLALARPEATGRCRCILVRDVRQIGKGVRIGHGLGCDGCGQKRGVVCSSTSSTAAPSSTTSALDEQARAWRRPCATRDRCRRRCSRSRSERRRLTAGTSSASAAAADPRAASSTASAPELVHGCDLDCRRVSSTCSASATTTRPAASTSATAARVDGLAPRPARRTADLGAGSVAGLDLGRRVGVVAGELAAIDGRDTRPPASCGGS